MTKKEVLAKLKKLSKQGQAEQNLRVAEREAARIRDQKRRLGLDECDVQFSQRVLDERVP